MVSLNTSTQVIQRDGEALAGSPVICGFSEVFVAISDGSLRAELLYQFDLVVGTGGSGDARAFQCR